MKFTRLELLSSFDRLAQSVLLVTLDIEAADLRERAVAETRDQALFELLSLAFDILSAFLEQSIEVERSRGFQRQRNLAPFRQVQPTFARLMSRFRDEVLGGRARCAVRFATDRPVDAPTVHHDVDTEQPVAIPESLKRDSMLVDTAAGLELTHSRAREFEKGLGHYAPSLIRRESCNLDLRGHLDRPSSISAGWKEAARREQRCGRSPNVGGAGPIAAPWVPPPTATP